MELIDTYLDGKGLPDMNFTIYLLIVLALFSQYWVLL